MAEWEFAQRDSTEHLARLQHFSTTKMETNGEVEFVIAVYEYITPKDPAMKFLARADKEVNQKIAPITPVGWGNSLIQALSACMDMIRKFPYEG